MSLLGPRGATGTLRGCLRTFQVQTTITLAGGIWGGKRLTQTPTQLLCARLRVLFALSLWDSELEPKHHIYDVGLH